MALQTDSLLLSHHHSFGCQLPVDEFVWNVNELDTNVLHVPKHCLQALFHALYYQRTVHPVSLIVYPASLVIRPKHTVCIVPFLISIAIQPNNKTLEVGEDVTKLAKKAQSLVQMQLPFDANLILFIIRLLANHSD
jgi:hypothetical protein